MVIVNIKSLIEDANVTLEIVFGIVSLVVCVGWFGYMMIFGD